MKENSVTLRSADRAGLGSTSALCSGRLGLIFEVERRPSRLVILFFVSPSK